MRRALLVVIGAVVVLGGAAGLLAVFSARDDAGLTEPAASGPGKLEPDKGAAHDGRAPDSRELATSGAHEPRLLARDQQGIDGNALLHALELGNVVIAYPDRRTPAALRALQEDVTGGYDPEIAAAGQAVILARVPGIASITALAWRRKLAVDTPDDPQLREFVDAWLGEGAPN